MRDTLDMAFEANLICAADDPVTPWSEVHDMTDELKAFEALVRADERWEQSKRRGVLAFCPYTGRPRHPSDIASDPHGILILVPDQPLPGMKP